MTRQRMKRQKMFLAAAILAILISGEAGTGRAQTPEEATKLTRSESTKNAKTESWTPGPKEAYHIDFSILELEDGKKINTRQYSTNLNTNDSSEIRIGTRVPVESKEGEFQYLDVGTNIFARIGDERGQAELTVKAEISNFAVPEQSERPVSRPVLRQLKIGGTTLLPLGKPMIMGSVDDPNSKRQFQLEVTVVKLR
jgi:hypothetical protein